MWIKEVHVYIVQSCSKNVRILSANVLSMTQAEQIINSLLLDDDIMPASSKKKTGNCCGTVRSLVMVRNQLPARVVKATYKKQRFFPSFPVHCFSGEQSFYYRSRTKPAASEIERSPATRGERNLRVLTANWKVCGGNETENLTFEVKTLKTSSVGSSTRYNYHCV